MRGKISPIIRKLTLISLLGVFFFGATPDLVAQIFTDGPVNLRIRLRRINTKFAPGDEALLGIGFAPEELSYRVWVRDNVNLGWTGGTCHTQDFLPAPGGVPSQNWNDIMINTNFAGGGANVAGAFDIRIDCWEDDLPSDALAGFCNSGTRCTFQTPQCCGIMIAGTCIGITTGDDFHCNANPFRTGIQYRNLGPPCQWSTPQFFQANNNGVCANASAYEPEIDVFWRYTDGTSCGNSRTLGTLTPGGGQVFSHYNSTECYSNVYSGSPGNDVTYSFTITGPMAIRASLCGATTNFDSHMYLLDGTCTQIADNGNHCGNVSEITKILCPPSFPASYYIVVDGETGSDFGVFDLTLQEQPGIMVQAVAGNAPLPVCQGTAVQLGGNPPYMNGNAPFQIGWINISGGPNPSQVSNPVVTPPNTTSYEVTVTDSNGCVSKDSVTVSINQPPTPSLGPDTAICNGTAINISPGTGYQSYAWNTGSSQNTINVNTPGLYFVNVTDVNNCNGSDTINVTNAASPPLFLGNDTTICQGDSITLNAGAGAGYSYLWQGGQNSQTINVQLAGTYYVTLTAGNSCTSNDTINVAVSAIPPSPNMPDDTICQGGQAMFDAGPGYSTYTWSNGSNNQMIFPTTAGTYSVILANAFSCAVNDTVDLVVNPLPTVNLGAANQTVCADSILVLNAGSGYTTYNWNTGATSDTLAVTFPGLYYVNVVDANGCTNGDTIQLAHDTVPIVNLGPDTILCAGASITLDAGQGYNSYVWSTGGFFPTEPVSGSPGTNQTVTVTVEDGNGCDGTDEIELTWRPNITLDLGQDTTICEHGQAILNAGSGMVTYLWSDGSSNQTLPVGAPGGQFYVTVTDPFLCTESDTINVNVSSTLTGTVFSNPDTSVCEDGILIMDAGSHFVSYSWSNGSTDQFQTFTTGDTLQVSVIDTQGCVHNDEIRVEALDVPDLELGPDQFICPNEQLPLDAGPAYDSYLWTTGETSQVIMVDAIGDYGVTVMYRHCSYSDEININDNCPEEILVPNVFSPNGDGINDIMQFVGPNVEDFQVFVFDRWGKKVFESLNIQTSWDGLDLDGKEVSEGTYYYVTEYKFFNNEKIWKERGAVVLIR